MKDHLLSFPSEADAKAHPVMAQWLQDGDWNRSVTFPDVRLVTDQGDFPGWWIVVSAAAIIPELAEIEPCRMIADRELGRQGLPFIHAEGLRADPAQIAQVTRIDGLASGSAYPMQNPMVIT
jgi:hypothetical protein